MEARAAGQDRRNHLRGAKRGLSDDTSELSEPRCSGCGLHRWQIHLCREQEQRTIRELGSKSESLVKKTCGLFLEVGRLTEGSAVLCDREAVIPTGDPPR